MRLKRRETVIVASAALAASAGAAATIVQAQGAAPTVSVTVAARQVTLQGAEALQAGTTRFAVRRAGRGEHELDVAALKPGTTPAEFEAVLRRVRDPDSLLRFVTLAGGVGLFGTRSNGAVTLTLEPNTSYIVLDSGGDNPRRWPMTSFTVGAATQTAVAPRRDAVVSMRDYRFTGARNLPRNGTVRFKNLGSAPHFAIAFPLRPGADSEAAERAARGNQERALNRLVAGAPSEPQTLITAGAVNDNEFGFAGRGRYLLVCFFETDGKGHNERGMVKTVRVR